MDGTQQILTLPSGRHLSYAIYGDVTSSRRTVFYHHGFPGSRIEGSTSISAAAAAHSLRLVAVDRPGYGGSTFQPGRKLLDWPADLLALADHLLGGEEQFAVLGTSGGGPYALAAYHVLGPEGEGVLQADGEATGPRRGRGRCLGVALLCSLYPPSLGGSAGQLPGTWVILATAQWSTWLVEKIFGLSMDFGAIEDREHPERLEAVMGDMMKKGGFPAEDAVAWATGGRDNADGDGGAALRRGMVESMREAMSGEGVKGAAWEGYVLGSDWGFGLDEVRVQKEGQLVMFHGAKDLNVPVAMAHRGRDKLISGSGAAKVHYFEKPDEAHISLVVNEIRPVMEALERMFSL